MLPRIPAQDMGSFDVPLRIAHGHVLKDYLAIEATRLGSDGPANAGKADISFPDDVAVVILVIIFFPLGERPTLEFTPF
jgi:hypothetical protein